MRSRDQVIWDFVQGWLRMAEMDCRVAETLIERRGQYTEAVAFHSQQAAEKFIKAMLVRHQVEFPKTHDIALLRGLLASVEPHFAGELSSVDWLTQFGVEVRYPSHAPELSVEVGDKALGACRRARSVIMEALESYLSAGRPDS